VETKWQTKEKRTWRIIRKKREHFLIDKVKELLSFATDWGVGWGTACASKKVVGVSVGRRGKKNDTEDEIRVGSGHSGSGKALQTINGGKKVTF